MHAPERTWDDVPIADEPPYGASVVVYRRGAKGLELLLLHRGHLGPEEGDWSWTPPSGARWQGEAIDACARRELSEETGLELPLKDTACGDDEWHIYLAEASHADGVVLDNEHDRYLWLSPREAIAKVSPLRPRKFLESAAQALM
jgi:8-oxo-dGTP pyrophosphatase MutT (NUDIX family)